MYTRPQQFWRTLQSTYWRSQQVSEIFHVFGNTVSHITLQMVPNPFIRIQLVPLISSQVSGNSNLAQPEDAQCDWDGKQLSSAVLLLRQPDVSSTDRWNSHSLRRLAKEYVSAHSFAFGLISQASLVPAWSLILVLLFSQRTASRDELNLQSNRSSWPQPTDPFLSLTTRWPVGVASRNVVGSHMVSWNHIIKAINMFLLLLRKSIASWLDFGLHI